MSNLDVSGVIGTWLGAGIGIIALVGIVGPLLVWQATRTERFKALAAIGEDSHGFISRGIPISPNIRIFRQVRAPMLQRAPDFTSKKFAWDQGKLPEKSSPSSWVELGVLLKVYDNKFPVGREIEVHCGKTYLRFHRAWVLAVGLMGRFSRRDDKGQMKSRRSVMLRFGATPDVGPVSFRNYDDQGIPYVQDHNLSSDELHGITRTMKTTKIDLAQGTDQYLLNFKLDRKSAMRFEPERLSLTQLFMLSIGCIPMANNDYFSLRDLGTFESDIYDGHSSDSDRDDVHYRERYPDRENRFKRDEYTYADRDHRYMRREIKAKYRRGRTRVQTFKLEPVIEREERLIEIGKPFAAENVTVFSLQSFRPSQAEDTSLEKIKNMTYLPASSEWVRLGEASDLKDSLDNSQAPEVYVVRGDAQRMALALLQLPWHPEGYLLGADKSDDCLRLLLMCSTHLTTLMGHSQRGIDHIDLTAPEKKELVGSIESLYRRFERSSLRPILHEMLKLDKILIKLSHKNVQVNEMIGIMMITNREFMSLVRQSARRFDQAPNATIKVDMRSGVLKTPSAFGILQEFPLSITELYPGRTLTDEVISVSYSAVLISTLRACLRSTMLRDCFSSNPLITKVLDFDSTVYVS